MSVDFGHNSSSVMIVCFCCQSWQNLADARVPDCSGSIIIGEHEVFISSCEANAKRYANRCFVSLIRLEMFSEAGLMHLSFSLTSSVLPS